MKYELITLPIKWSGWTLVGRDVREPRKVFLTPAEAKILSILLIHRIAIGKAGKAGKVKQESYISSEELCARAKMGKGTMLSTITTLRHGVGQAAIQTLRGRGYRVLPANQGLGTTRQPIDALIDKMELCLEEAKRIRLTLNQRDLDD